MSYLTQTPLSSQPVVGSKCIITSTKWSLIFLLRLKKVTHKKSLSYKQKIKENIDTEEFNKK